MKYILMIRGWLCMLLCVYSLSIYADNLATIPALTAPVMDTAQMMQPEKRTALNQQLLNFSHQKGSQIVVLTVPKIAPETSFDYATRVMDTWQPGRKGIDDGVLLLLVRDEHQTFLAVGRGLEGAIPDIYAKQIQDHTLQPRLQQGQIDTGIIQAVTQLEQLINGEKLPSTQPATTNANGLSFNVLLISFFIFILIFGQVLKFIFGRLLSSGLIGFAILCIGWYLHWTLLQSLLLSIAAAAIAWAMSFMSLYQILNLLALLGNGGKGGNGGNDGFRGGGGGFGGGGASGRW